MARVIVSPAPAAEEAILALLQTRCDVDSVVVDVFKVNDFLGISLEIADSHNESFYLTGPSGMARSLNQLGVKTGDEVLVARHPYQLRSGQMYVVSPLTDLNQYLVGKGFTAQPKAGRKAVAKGKAGLKQESR